MICSVLRTLVYPVGLAALRTFSTSRTDNGPALQRTRRMSSSALVGRGRLARMAVSMTKVSVNVNEDLRHSMTKFFVVEPVDHRVARAAAHGSHLVQQVRRKRHQQPRLWRNVDGSGIAEQPQ